MADNAKPPPKGILKTRRNNRAAAGAVAEPKRLTISNAAPAVRVFNWNAANKANMSKQYRNAYARSAQSRSLGINIPAQATVNRNRSGRKRNIELIKKYYNQPEKLAAVQERLQQRHVEALPVAAGVGAGAATEARKIQEEFLAQEALKKEAEENNIDDELNKMERELEFIHASIRKPGVGVARPRSAFPVRPAAASPLASAGAGLLSQLGLPPLPVAAPRRAVGATAGSLNLSRLAGRSPSPAPSPARAMPSASGISPGAAAAGGLGASGLRGLLGPPGSIPQPAPPRAAIGTARFSLPKRSPNKPQGGGRRKSRKTRKASKSRRRSS